MNIIISKIDKINIFNISRSPVEKSVPFRVMHTQYPTR